MTKETRIWLIVLAIGVALMIMKGVLWGGLGRAYVREVPQTLVQVERPIVAAGSSAHEMERVWVPANSPDETAAGTARTLAQPISWTKYDSVLPKEYFAHEPDVALSAPRTVGLWIAALLTLCLFSFLYRDNPFYKLAEAVFIGVSAAYWMVVAFWNVIVPNLLGALVPGLVRNWCMPGLESTEVNWIYVIPLILGVMLLWRMVPVGSWIARWPLALFIGVFAGLRMVQFIQADFLNQIRNGIEPLVVQDQDAIAWGTSLRNMIAVLGVLACLTYFFFSIEHKGAVGRVARVGTWVLMITFGAMFGYTVMGRIALLTGRFEFLFDDWLWLIDPTGKRSAAAAAVASIGLV